MNKKGYIMKESIPIAYSTRQAEMKDIDLLLEFTRIEAEEAEAKGLDLTQVQQAIEAVSNFIGETIPVIERETGRFLGSINEGDIFKLYLKLQGQTQDLERR